MYNKGGNNKNSKKRKIHGDFKDAKENKKIYIHLLSFTNILLREQDRINT